MAHPTDMDEGGDQHLEAGSVRRDSHYPDCECTTAFSTLYAVAPTLPAARIGNGRLAAAGNCVGFDSKIRPAVSVRWVPGTIWARARTPSPH